MELTTTYKKVLAVVVLLLVGFMSQAQHIVVVGSARTFKVPEVSGHVYQWEVLYGDVIQKLNKEANGTYTVGVGSLMKVGSIDPGESADSAFAITFIWPSKGNFTIRMTEANARACTTENIISVSVVDSPLFFKLSKKTNYDIVASQADGNRLIVLPVSFENSEVSNAWAQDYYDRHKLNSSDNTYSVVLDVTYVTKDGVQSIGTIVKEVSNELPIVYDCKVDYTSNYKESEYDTIDRYLEFEIKSVKDRYGADVLNKENGNNKFVFGIYKKTPITKINHK